MASIIETLRSHCGKSGEVWSEDYEEITVALDEYLSGEDGYPTYTVEAVSRAMEDGGRWSNFCTIVYRVEEGEEVAYFSMRREEPASESQDGMDLTYGLDEVVPKEVTVTRYVTKEVE